MFLLVYLELSFDMGPRILRRLATSEPAISMAPVYPWINICFPFPLSKGMSIRYDDFLNGIMLLVLQNYSLITIQ